VKRYITAFLAAGLAASGVAWAQYAPAGGQPVPLTPNVEQRSYTVTGAVVSVRSDALVVRIDDHHHRITFALGPRVSPAALKAGSRVSVRYHPAGTTGQIVDEVEVLASSQGR
jgi:hypothetical protein